MSGAKWYRRRWLQAVLALNGVLLAAGLWFGFSYYRAFVGYDRPQPVWSGPLTAEQREDVFRALCREVDRRYPYLEAKGIDWNEVQARFWPEAECAPDDQAFYDVLQRMLASLHDGHTALLSYPGMFYQNRPPVDLAWVEGQPVVVSVPEFLRSRIRPGDAVVAVDHRPVDEVVARLQARTSASSVIQMNVMTAWSLLSGRAGSEVAVGFRTPEGQDYTVSLRRPLIGEDVWAESGGSAVEARPAGAFGYIRIKTWRGDAATAFDRALEAFRDAPGLILDVRGNGGGDDGLAAQVAGRFVGQETVWTRCSLRMCPFWTPTLAHVVAPRGPWTYTGKVAVLIDGAVFSSNDFFVGGLVRSGRATAIGTATGGGSGNPAVITLPGGARVRLSRWQEFFADGTLVEGTGTEPDIEVTLTRADIAAGRDPVLERAVAFLAGAP